MRVIKLVLVLAIMLLGVAFAVQNADMVNIDYYFGVQELPLALVIIAALIAGAVLGVISCMGVMMRLRHEAGDLRRKQKLSQQEIDNLRALPIKD